MQYRDGTPNAGGQVAIAYQCHGNNVGPIGTVRQGNGSVTGGVPFIINAAESCAKQSHARQADVARCIDSTGSFANAQGGTVVAQPVAFDTTQVSSPGNYSHPKPGDPCHPLAARAHPPAVVQPYAPDVAFCLAASQRHTGDGHGQAWNSNYVAETGRAAMAVRRLTPKETERIQGFPDDWTAVEFRGKPAADGNRYRAVGNSMAVPVLVWIGKRIEQVEEVAA